MRVYLAGIVAALALAPGAGAAVPAALTLVKAYPATVQGRHFRASERVSVVLVVGPHRWSKTVRAGISGAFVVTFPGVRIDYCALPLTLKARGARTGTVVAHLPIGECAAP